MILIKRNWATDRVELEKTFAAMKERKWPVCTSSDLNDADRKGLRCLLRELA